MRLPQNFRLPDPYVLAPLTGDFNAGTVLGGTANLAYILPVLLPASATVYSVSIACTTATGDYDIGLYRGDLTKIQSSGAVAFSTTGTKTLTLTGDARFKAGEMFLVAMSMSSGSGRVAGWTINNNIQSQVFNWGQQSTAHPLPDPLVPVADTTTNMPFFALGIR